MTKVGVDNWSPTNYTETIYTPSNTVFHLSYSTIVNEAGSTTLTLYLGSNYHSLTFNPNNTRHADGIQFVSFLINITGALDDDENITGANIYRTSSSQSLGEYGNNDTNNDKWGLYAEVSSTSIRVFVKGRPRSYTSGLYRMDFITSKGRALTVYIYINSANGYQISGFKSLASTYAPQGYPKTVYVSYVRIGTNIVPGYYFNKRWVMCTDNKYYNDNTNRPLAEDSSGLWYAFNDSLNYYSEGNSSGTEVIENSYTSVSMELVYPKYVNNVQTSVSLGSKQIGSTYTVPANSEAGARTHYTFSRWEYKGATVSAGQTIQSYPGYGSLTSVWKPNDYTVTFVINESSSTPSSVEPRTIAYGSVTYLPTLSSPTAVFNGWSDGTTTYPANYPYSPTADVTLTAVFTSRQFTVKFYDGDGDEIPNTSQTVTYPATVSVPSTAELSNLTFLGWASRGTTNILVGPLATSYQPSYSVDLVRIYGYSLTLSWQGGGSVVFDGYYSKGLTISVPKQDSPNRPILSGYRFSGWKKTSLAPSLNSNPIPDYDSGTVPITLGTDFNILYATYSPATLMSVAIASHSTNVRVGERINIQGTTITFQPSDWKGTFEWVSQGNPNDRYFELTEHQNDNGVEILGKETTTGVNAYAIIRGLKETWNPSAGYTSDRIYVTVSDFIQVTFHTRNELGQEMLYGVYSVDDSDGYSWVDGEFPEPPTRRGFVFDGWVDAEGHTVTEDTPPHYPIDVYATWLSTYTPIDRDMLILQKFSNDGKTLEYSIDMGVVMDMNETFSLSLNTMPTPTKSSENTFITDLYVTETIKFEITRKNPIRHNDESDNPLAWSNGYWVERVRALVDRWQSESDGVKVLYIPRGLTHTTVNGEDIYFGDNYDLLGYVRPRTEDNKTNPGLLYGSDNVLVGYNGICTAFSDTYTAGMPDLISISMTITLGGMQAGYEELTYALLGGNQ